MSGTDPKLERTLHQRFEEANSIAELRECLRDIEEELHSVFATQLSRFAAPTDERSNRAS